MGDISEMMLEGGLCQVCGKHVGENDGYPKFCSLCSEGEVSGYECSQCNKIFNSHYAAKQHFDAKHLK